MSTVFATQSDRELKVDEIEQQSSLAELFVRACAENGSRLAVTLGEKSLSYNELNQAANRVAQELVSRGAGPDEIVAIYLERSIEMVVAMLAVVKSGAAYLPLDPMYPAARIAETVEDAGPLAVLTSDGLRDRLKDLTAEVLVMDELNGEDCDPNVTVHGQDVAYVIYTSGSTGRPKGVMVSHANVRRLLSETQKWFRFDSSDVWTMFHSFAFDFSVWEMWGCLLSGGRLVIVPFTVSRSPEEFHALLVNERVTVLNQTPSAFVMLSQADARAPAAKLSLRVIVFGGEKLALGSLRGWVARHGDTKPELVNMYGITETTVHVTYRRILAADAEHETESVIGEPIPDMQIHLLDGALRPVGVGEEGEMWIGGGGVALGYLNRATLTADRFFADPFADSPSEQGARLYRTGDMARRREDGELVYLGRRDSQVKINGFRIELGEVEAAIMAHPAIVQACVVPHAESSGAARLAAYYVAKPGPQPSTRELSTFLAERLPLQMMPAFYIGLDAFPLTPNGKIDRHLLPEPQTGSHSTERKSLTHATSLEYKIARIWQMVLKTESIGLDDNFFDVGGTSLLLIAVRTGIEEQLDRPIPVTWMFEYTTIRSLARQLSSPEQTSPPMIEKRQNNVMKQRDAFARARAARGVAQ